MRLDHLDHALRLQLHQNVGCHDPAQAGEVGLPVEFVEQFDRAMKNVLAQPDLQEKLAKMGNEVTAAPSKEVEQWVVDASRGWGKVIRDSGFKAQ
jgi:tripartite-type tricarboxylate transporter receptor subunit TctC